MPHDDSSRDDPALAAVLRLVEGAGHWRGVGCYRATAAGPRLAAATSAFLDLVAQSSSPGSEPEDLERGVLGALGLGDGRCEVAPLPGLAGWLVLAGGPDPSRSGLLADAALVAARLLGPPVQDVNEIEAGDDIGRLPAGAGSRGGRSDAVSRWMEAVMAGRRARRYAVLLLDLDRFRALNETLGSALGDEVLTNTARRITASLRSGEELLRLEGDRFAVLAEAGGTDPRSLADRLLRSVARSMEIGGRSITVQASIGIADGLRFDEPAGRGLRRADAALRRAKLEGRNRYVLHVPDIDLADLERSRLEFDLAHAVAEGQMRLAFQPYVALATGEVAGAEALLRWRHPARGELGPASFVPLAETTGAILSLGAWSLRQALASAAIWPDRTTLSVNISPVQFHQPRFLAEVDAALGASSFPARRLELEVTESVLMQDSPQTAGVLRALIARGIRIALDDFGTGYSALAYLSRLPHHRIKLDRSFVRDLANPATAELIRALVASARAQGVAVTAEGVESEAQLQAVRAMGFTHAQGFATGAPSDDPGGIFSRVPV